MPKEFCYIRYVKVEDAVKLYETLMKESLVVQGRTIRCDFDAETPTQIKTIDGEPSTCPMLAYGDVQDVQDVCTGD